MNDANGTIQQQSHTISQKDSKIAELNNKISSLNSTIQSEKNKRQSIQEKLNDVCSAYPVIVTKCEVSSSQFSFDYYSAEEKEITVTLKAVNEKNSEVVSNNHTLTFYKGGGSKSLSFNYSLNSSDYYYVVLIYDGKIIAGKRW